MALYLAVHSPRESDPVSPTGPADLTGLAKAGRVGGARWIRSYSPDLHDDRYVSLWEADTADDVRVAMERFRFFVECDSAVFAVREWGPEDVLAATPAE